MPSQPVTHAVYNPVRAQSPDHPTPDTEVSDHHTSASPQTDKYDITPAKWGFGWQCPVMMIGFVMCGMALSVGHHLYYHSLDDTLVNSVNQQTWAIRIGTGFAFLTRSFLVSAVGVAAAQEIWATLRKKNIRLYGIDSMFAVLNSPVAFFTWDLWIYAKTLTVLAIISWLIPLTAIITPATLSVHLLTKTNTTWLRVPTVNFAEEPFWLPWASYGGAGYIDSPSPDISRLFAATTSSMEVLPVSAPFPNSSYTLEFWGPSYKCEKLSDAMAQMQGMTFTQPFGENYTSLKALWDYEITNSTEYDTNFYTGANPTLLNNTLFIYAAGTTPQWNNNSSNANENETGTELVCQLWNTSYSINLTFTDGVQTLTPLHTTFLNPANWTSDAGRTSPLPLTASEHPFVNSGFYIMHLLFTGLLQRRLVISVTGSLSQFMQSEFDRPSMSITQTGLFSCPELWNSSAYRSIQLVNVPVSTRCRNQTLASAIEDLSHNFTYSLLSLNAANTSVPVSVSFPQNFYRYDWVNLAIAYAVAVGVTVGCILVGFVAMYRNGVAQNTSFSSVLLTTRNLELDQLAIGNCLANDSLEEEVGRVRLKFGEVQVREGGYRHVAFGLEGSVTAISKGRDYY
ncbi:hypothetical protein BJX63DRAFT_443512 [Aspergillus granulosus]|uniref:Uncharacterized protein n=1 Tax=Aspergillus granulosus TaxID=176169 RepID=A0ABR4H9Y9_9EURO